MDDSTVLWIAAGVAGGAFMLRSRRGVQPRRASWDVPPVQRQQADRLTEAAALYRAGRGQDARILLRDRALDWDLIARAAAAQQFDPAARRIGHTLERDGMGLFLSELHRLDPTQSASALDTLASALDDYTGPTAESGER